MGETELEIEQKHLAMVYQKLVQAEVLFSEILQNAKKEGISALESMKGDVSLNFDSVLDNLDTFSMIEIKNREIDQMNLNVKTADTTLQKVRMLLKSPYFGKVEVDFLDGEPREDFYIGMTNFTDESGNILVYDWRSPVTELFYNNVMGPTFYLVHGNKIDVKIEGRRQFVIEKNQLLKYFDTSIAIQDDVLLEALEQGSSRQMKDITTTIQREQNVIIREMQHPILLVNGVAGSGKTSTIMQRIAYLLYSLRQEITSDNILILSPNNQFITYIADVLPTLGEKNPLNITMRQFVEKQLSQTIEDEATYFSRISSSEVSSQTSVIRSQAFSHFIKNADALLSRQPLVFCELTRKGNSVISKEKIAEIYYSTPDTGKLMDRVQATKRRLISYWEQFIRKQAKTRIIQDQILSLSETLQQKYFGELITDDSEESIYHYGKRLLSRRYQAVTKAIQQNKWLDSVALFESLYQAYTNDRYLFSIETQFNLDEAVLFLQIQHHFIEKINLPEMRFVLIDEIQDYTPAQLSLLADLFSKSQFTMVGDENQAIFNSASTFTDIATSFVQRKHEIKRYDLLNSYRASGAITKVFKSLALSNEEMEIVSIRPDGNQPEFFECHTLATFVVIVEQLLTKLMHEKLVIITKTTEEAEALKKGFTEQETLEIMPISLSKGLEFDHILVYNVSAQNYHTMRDQKILYTAVSRGMKNLFISYEWEISEFLASKK